MISGANENELEIANARAEILLMCGNETLKVIDKYYKQQLEAYENMRKEMLEMINYYGITEEENDDWFARYIFKEFLSILNKVGGSDE